MLADYFRQVGASVTVVRHVHALDMLKQKKWDLQVLSPGAGPARGFRDFENHRRGAGEELPIFGVCLGVQAIGEYFGGRSASSASLRMAGPPRSRSWAAG